MPAKALAGKLAKRWPQRDPSALVYGVRTLLPLVQVPPRGVWGVGGQPSYATVETWVGRELETNPSIDDMVLRYLGAFGPASVKDVQAWSGLTRLREVVERLRPQLATFVDEDGHELFDLPGSPRPDPETPAPPRFLAEFDNAILSHADRRRIISDEHRRRIATRNGMVPGTVLVQGRVRGQWKVVRTRRLTSLRVELYERISKRDAAAVTSEGKRLLDFAASESESHEVEIIAAA